MKLDSVGGSHSKLLSHLQQTILDQVESLKSLMQQLKSMPTGHGTWERQSNTSMPSWKVQRNLMRTNDIHQGCDTSRELKRSFKSTHKQQIEEELKDPLMYQGNAGKPILKRMNP